MYSISVRVCCVVLCLLVVVSACGRPEKPSPQPEPSPLSVMEVRAAADPMEACVSCHPKIVEAYRRHGMARSLGPVGTPEPGVVTNPRTGNRYEILVDSTGAWLKGTLPGGGTRFQRLVGRIGAGHFDTSWIGEEINPVTSQRTGRLFFAPVETVTDHGLALSPFELHPEAAGFDMALTEGCLTCHTDTDLESLPNAAASPDGRAILPANLLGGDAFEHLAPLTCAACHGDGRAHIEMMSGLPDENDAGLGFETRTPVQQRDVCARCHLQGDARFELVTDNLRSDIPLAGQIPVLVPAHADDDFRFVGQVERLTLSACFENTPEMNCSTCHDPHMAVKEQGVASFDVACKSCHEVAVPHTALTVAQVTGEAGRTPDGCVDCHVRRSQPFDLPHIRTADHFIRRRIPKPAQFSASRQFANPQGALAVYDDGRLAPSLATPEGQRWRDGVMGMGLVVMGRLEEAVVHFEVFPAPGTPAALQPTAPSDLTALETAPSFHQMRGLALLAARRPQEALDAFSDALTLDPSNAGARLERAKLRVMGGDMQGALKDTDVLLAAHPRAEVPWNVRSTLALRAGSMEMAVSALEVSTKLWASDGRAWQQLGGLYSELGRDEEARRALEHAQALLSQGR